MEESRAILQRQRRRLEDARNRCAASAAPVVFFFSSRRRHTRSDRDWSSDVCSSDLIEGDSVAEATIYLSDGDRREDGGNRFYRSGTLPRSCGRLLRVFPLSVRLAPHASQGVRVALDGADTLSAACWSIVFVESGAAPTGRGRQLAYITRLGVKIYGLPAGLAKDGMIDELVERGRRPGAGKFAADSGGQRFEVTVRNNGGPPLWGRGPGEV